MVAYSRAFQPGSVEFQNRIDPDLGRPRFQPGSVEWKNYHTIEHDATRVVAEREAARIERIASERAGMQAAADELAATSIVPPGFVVVRHISDLKASISSGHALEQGCVLIKAPDAETAANFGFRPVNYPPKD